MDNNGRKKIVIIGAGPAGIAAAYRLAQDGKNEIIVIEKENWAGGLSRTFHHNGYRIDIGPHRFFSKSDKVNAFWHEILADENDFRKVKRTTRIFFLGKFFDYPISLDWNTFKNLGLIRMTRIIFSYLRQQIIPIKPEKSLADFYTNRFGKELYETFFKDYTEKVWGVPCSSIPPDWGSQRVKGLSIRAVINDIFKKIIGWKKNKETSLIESFEYPKYGAGQMYESAAKKAADLGVKIIYGTELSGLNSNNNKINEISIKNIASGKEEKISCDRLISSMAIKDLVEKLNLEVPKEIKEISDGLIYRDYIIIGLLLDKASIKGKSLPDNWIYIQERQAKMGRLDIFNNFSIEMLEDKTKSWLGAEYFCDEGDQIWSKNDDDLAKFALEELISMNFDKSPLYDFKVIRIKKAYPSYFGTFKDFHKVKEFLDNIENLHLIGRNGMHRYNNMDHSILSGIETAEMIINNKIDKEYIWKINTESEYHEKK